MRAVATQSPSSSRSATQARTTAARDSIRASSEESFAAAQASFVVVFGFVMASSFAVMSLTTPHNKFVSS